MTIPASALDALSALLGSRLSTSASERDIHGASEAYHRAPPPDAVAYPQDTAEVSAILSICNTHAVPVIGFGAGTSLEGHTLATNGGLTVSFAQMDRIIALRPQDMLVVVQPGVSREALNEELRATGLFFPVDPGANASLGGMAATCASGTTAVRYGTMRDNILALEVVLADGRVLRCGTRAAKSSAGYDLTSLLVGSEGTLGLITELTVKLHGQPEEIAAAVCAFPTLEAAVECITATIQSGIPMARIEFVNQATVAAFNRFDAASLPEQPHLLVEFHGSPSAVKADAEAFGMLVEEFGGNGFDRATTPEERNRLWRMRHGAYRACMALRPGASAMITDVCVPMSELADAVSQASADIEVEGLTGPIYGHVGDGNFHAQLLLDPGSEAELAAARRVATRMAERAIAAGGTISGEHGIGIGKRALMAAQHGEAWQVMGTLKAALDPKGILNPGKLIPDPPP